MFEPKAPEPIIPIFINISLKVVFLKSVSFIFTKQKRRDNVDKLSHLEQQCIYGFKFNLLTLFIRPVEDVITALFASPAYLKKSDSIKKLSDLRHYQTISFIAEGDNVWKLRVSKKEEVVEILPSIKTNTPKLAFELALAGQGIVLLPEWLCKDALTSEKLVEILEQYKTAPIDIQFVWPAHREMNRKIRAFVDIAAKKLVNYFINLYDTGHHQLPRTVLS